MKKIKLDLLLFAGGRGQNLSFLKIGANLLTNSKSDVVCSISAAEIDVTDDSSAGFKEFIEGDRECTISGSYNYQASVETAALAQDAIINAATGGGDLVVVWAYETGTGENEYTGTGILTSFASNPGDPQTQNFTIRIKGAWVESTQS